MPFGCEIASVFPDLADFFPAFNCAFSAFRVALSEDMSTSLTPSLFADNDSATAVPFPCSFASFFNLLVSFRASFESLLSLVSPLAAIFPISPTIPFIGRASLVS